MAGEWTDEWPTEPGEYWFYGWEHGKREDMEKPPEMSFVRARQGRDSMFYVAGGHFIYRQEAVGKWTKANLPDPPTLDLERELT
jgi:hypothetical protein